MSILAGSDRRPGRLPESAAGLHPLASYKGAAIRIGGRPLLALLVERLAAARGLGPVTLAGPARVLGPLGLDARIVDTDGSVATNLRAALEAHLRAGGGPLCVLACDVLPSGAELSALRARFEQDPPCAVWFPFVRVPEDAAALGAFAWKPVYRIAPAPGAEPVRILPGHLGILDPDALRLPLLYRLLDSAYRTRNRSVAARRASMLRAVLASLLWRDLGLLARLRAPSRTATVASSGLRVARALRRGALELGQLERLVGRIFLRAHVPPERGVRYPLVDTLSLAEDVDTEEEAAWLVRAAPQGP